MSKLTAKQEKFVQGLVAGLSQRQAYRKAYPSSLKWKDETVDTKASQALKIDKILARYDELMDEHKQKALWTREEAVKDLKWLKDQAIKSIVAEQFDEGYVRQGTSGALIGAIQELNKLEGLYPSEKLDANVTSSIVFVEDVPEDD